MNNLKEINVKNRTCYYLDYIINIIIISIIYNISMGKKSYENILVYDIWYKTLIGPKPLPIRFDQVDGLIRVTDGTI